MKTNPNTGTKFLYFVVNLKIFRLLSLDIPFITIIITLSYLYKTNSDVSISVSSIHKSVKIYVIITLLVMFYLLTRTSHLDVIQLSGTTTVTCV